MLVTNIGDNYKMLVTVLAILVTIIHYSIQSLTSTKRHQYHRHGPWIYNKIRIW